MHSPMHPLLCWIGANMLLSVTGCYLVGNICGFFLPLTWLSIRIGLLLTTGGALFLYRNKREIALPLLLLFFSLTGYTLTQSHLAGPQDPSHIASLISDKTEVSLTGILLNYPEFDGHKTRFGFQVKTLLIPTTANQQDIAERQPTHGRIRLTMAGSLPAHILPGDKLLVRASLDRVHNYLTPGAFNYRLYLLDKGIHLTGWIRSPLQLAQLPPTKPSVLHQLRFFPERLRYRIGNFLRDHLDDNSVGLYQALLIGSRSAISPDTLEQFKTSGCIHLLAISGMHMGLLAIMLIGSLSWLLKRSSWLILHIPIRTVSITAAMLPLTLYALVAGFNSPVVRALTMTGFFILALVIRRQGSLVHSIAAAVLLICLVRPLALFTVSFQLSFAAVLAITIIFPRLLDLISGAGKMNPHSSDLRNSPPATNTLLDSAGLKMSRSMGLLVNRILAVLGVSLAATIGILPLLLYSFNRFSPIGPFINLLIEPLLCFWALPIGLIAVPFVWIQPDIAEFLVHLGSRGLILADQITAAAGKFNFASLWTVTPTFSEIFFYYALILLLYYRRQIRGGSLLALASVVLLFVNISLNQYIRKISAAGKTEVAFLDVGQGASTFIRMEDGTTVLIDGGGPSSPRFNVGTGIIAPFLWKKRIPRLDHLVITHPDADHYSGLDFIIRRFQPKKVWINGIKSENETYNKILAYAADHGMQIITPEAGQSLKTTAHSRLFCLGNPLRLHFETDQEEKKRHLSDNDLSLVFKLDHGKFSYLFTGDITRQVEQLLISAHDELQTTLLQASHHGSKTSNSPSFIEKIKPRLIVVSAGRHRGRHFPHPDHVKTWRQNNQPFVVTSQTGTTFSMTDGNFLKVETMTGESFNW